MDRQMDQQAVREKTGADPRSTDELIREALAYEGDEDDLCGCREIAILQARATSEVLHSAQVLCASASDEERDLGAAILGQLGWGEPLFREERFQALSEMLAREHDESVLVSVVYALGHLKDARAIQLVATLCSHPNPQVRQAVAFALGGYEDPHALEALIELTQDEDAEVRDWATFGLGSQTDADSKAIREALAARLGDEDSETWSEALIGLATRHDTRVVDSLLQAQQVGLFGQNVIDAAVLAMETFDDQRLCPLLHWLRERTMKDRQYGIQELDKAIAGCTTQE